MFQNAAKIFRETMNANKNEDICFTYLDVHVDKLSVNSAAGPDGVPAILLKKCKEVLSHPLACPWQKSLLTGEIQYIYKLAFIHQYISLAALEQDLNITDQ